MFTEKVGRLLLDLHIKRTFKKVRSRETSQSGGTSGIIEFGNRSQLRKVLNLATGNPLVAHHIIPWAKSTNAAIQKAAKSAKAFHMNEVLNGIPLTNAVHNGSHAVYDAKIVEYLEKIPTSATPDQAYDEVLKIINKVKIAIQNNPNTPINQLIF
jgi:hypothetical protein